jgi:Alpha/beta hydrolase
MTTIEVPATIPALQELESGVEAMGVTDDLRGAATSVSDVTTWTTDNGAPGGWQGKDADAAGHAATQFSRKADAVSAALTKVTAACDTYVTAMTGLEGDRLDLDEERIALNDDIAALTTRINSATEDQVEGLRSEAAALTRRATTLTGRITTWQEAVTTAEDTLVRAFESVDEQAEGERAADSQGVDEKALLAHLATLRTPKDVTDWWDGLTPEQQEALKVHSPDVVGNTNGIPSGDRDDANRGSLQRDLGYLQSLQDRGVELTEDQQQQLANAKAAQKGLDLGTLQLDPNTNQPVDTNLLLYVPNAFDGDGAVAIAYGNPDTADNTAVIVPGITNDGTSIAGQGEDALNLFLSANGKPGDESTCTIAWMGYDAPSVSGDNLLTQYADMGSVAIENRAEAGGYLLSGFVDGLRATDDGERSQLTVIGHSYGSTTAAHAATDGLDADRLVLVGSPGAGGGSDHVSDLNMPAGTVYVGSAENDFVTWLGRDDGGDGGLGMGEDPSQASFGAKRFAVDDGEEFHVNEIGSIGIGNHTSYFDEGSTSLGNVTTIVTGGEPGTIDGRTQDANDYVTDWAADEAKYQGGKAYDEYVAPVVEPIIETGKDIYEGGRDVVEGGIEVVTDPVGTFKGLFD